MKRILAAFAVLAITGGLYVLVGQAPAPLLTGPAGATGPTGPAGPSLGLVPAVGTADTLTCSTTPNITTQPVAFATTKTLPAFTQTAGAWFQVTFGVLTTQSVSPPNLTFTVKLDSATIYSGNTAGTAPSASGAAADFPLNIHAVVIGATGTLHAGIPSPFFMNGTQINHSAITTSFDTTATHTVTLTMQCSAATAGNTVTLSDIDLIQPY